MGEILLEPGAIKVHDATRSPLSVLDVFAVESTSPYASSSDAGASPFPIVSPQPLLPVAVGHENRRSPDLARSPCRSVPQRAGRNLPDGAVTKCSTPPKKASARCFDLGGITSCNLPLTPGSGRTRHRPRTHRTDVTRNNSLNDNKVLLATQLKRSDSVVSPSLFQFSGHFEFLSTLGSSKTSEVYKVRHRHTGELFAVKRCRHKFQTRHDRDRCMREIKAVSSLPGHPHIVGQYRAWQQEGHFYIQMDVCEGGSLAMLLEQSNQAGQLLPEELLWQVLSEIAQGLAFLHANGVLHLDIKPDNLYMDHEGNFKIGDFGLAWLREQWDWEEGDGRYVAPELLRVETEPSAAADVYSLGAALYECATGHLVPRSLLGPEAGSVLVPHRSSSFQWLLQQMLSHDPAGRPTAASLVQQVARLHGPVAPSPPPKRPDPVNDVTGGFSPCVGVAQGPTLSSNSSGLGQPLAGVGSSDRAVCGTAAPLLADTATSPRPRRLRVPSPLGDVPRSPSPCRTRASPTAVDPSRLRMHSPFAALANAVQNAAPTAAPPPALGDVSPFSRARTPSLLFGVVPEAGCSSLRPQDSYSMAGLPARVDSGTQSGPSRTQSEEADGSSSLSFGQRPAYGGCGGEGGDQGEGCGDQFPQVQPSSTPQLFGRQQSARRVRGLPPRAPSFSFNALPEVGPGRAASGEADEPAVTPRSWLARELSVVSLCDETGAATDSDSDPVPPTRLFGGMFGRVSSFGSMIGGEQSLSSWPSFQMADA